MPIVRNGFVCFKQMILIHKDAATQMNNPTTITMLFGNKISNLT